ncbi:13285_t:CDS:2 [Funneliformis geosporum]|uniref:18711_t:CDS:1 n=1 Tax=Funneliformis geosporum TaxID=1117311 RepID=A0A9W4SJI0_9GLOM|nr:13285_t:CDS:2 [Funneliformis geosporum]CAI2171689.1 18711_t:CDS:2 [Funneliformis geosporum]
MSQNPIQNNQNNLPHTNGGNLVRQNQLGRPRQNFVNPNFRPQEVYLDNGRPTLQRPLLNNGRPINPQVRTINPSAISQLRQSQLLASNYTSLQEREAAQNQIGLTNNTLAQVRPPFNNLSTQETAAENINSQAGSLHDQSTVNSINTNSNNSNQPAKIPTVQAGQFVNNSITQINHSSIIQGIIPQNITTGQQGHSVNNLTHQTIVSANISDQSVASSNTTSQPQNRLALEERKKLSQEPKHLMTPRKRLPPKKPFQPQIEKTLVKEFVITGSMINSMKKVNLMRLHRGNNVLDKFQPPVKLHRRDPEAPTPSAGTTRQNEDVAVVPPSKMTQQAASPTTGADTSKIAPFAGARHNKKNLFKKRTTQIYLADDRQRQLKAEERLPWVLEDYDGTHTWVGHFEETDAKYGFLIKDKTDENKLKFLPSHRWYTFRPQIKYKTLTIEEAEEEMARAKKRDNDRWMMRRWGKQNEKEKKLAEEEGGIINLKSTLRTVENEDDLFGSDDEGNVKRPRRGIQSEEEMEYEQVFEDDEEELPDDANPIDEENAEVVKLKKRAIHKPTSLEDEDEDEDSSLKLTQEGMQLKKLVRKFDDNEAYDDSDQESNPYASEFDESEEESSSESPARTPVIGAAGNKPTPTVKTDKSKSPAKPKTATKSTAKLSTSEETSSKTRFKSSDKPVVNQISGSMPQRISLGKRSTMYEPSSDDDRPTTHKRFRQNETAISSTSTSNTISRAASMNVSSNVRTTTGDIKRVREVKEPMSSTGKKARTEKPISGSQAAAQSAALSSISRADSNRLISEREVRQIISKNRELTVPTIIRAFRKRIQEDARNRDLLLEITKNVAILKDGCLVLKDKWGNKM